MKGIAQLGHTFPLRYVGVFLGYPIHIPRISESTAAKQLKVFPPDRAKWQNMSVFKDTAPEPCQKRQEITLFFPACLYLSVLQPLHNSLCPYNKHSFVKGCSCCSRERGFHLFCNSSTATFLFTRTLSFLIQLNSFNNCASEAGYIFSC